MDDVYQEPVGAMVLKIVQVVKTKLIVKQLVNMDVLHIRSNALTENVYRNMNFAMLSSVVAMVVMNQHIFAGDVLEEECPVIAH